MAKQFLWFSIVRSLELSLTCKESSKKEASYLSTMCRANTPMARARSHSLQQLYVQRRPLGDIELLGGIAHGCHLPESNTTQCWMIIAFRASMIGKRMHSYLAHRSESKVCKRSHVTMRRTRQVNRTVFAFFLSKISW